MSFLYIKFLKGMCNHMIKFLKLLIVFSLVALNVMVVGCSNKGKEKEIEDLVFFRIDHYNFALSSVPGQTIELNLDGAKFLCAIENGTFTFHREVKELIVESNEEFYWCPHYINDLKDVEEDSYVDVKILLDEQIIGYAVIKINYNRYKSLYTPKVLASKVFVDDDGKYQSVSDEYVEERIERYHKWWK